MKQPIPARALAFWDVPQRIGLIVGPVVERLPDAKPYPSADDCDESEPEE